MTHRDPPDLRLFGLAGGAWLAAVAVVPASAATAVATAVVAALLAAGVGVAFAVLARRDPGRWAVGVLGALVGVLLGVVCSGAAVAAGPPRGTRRSSRGWWPTARRCPRGWSSRTTRNGW
ncbi:hypothetical protein ACFQX7_12835 [Luedemannella flava]